MPIISFRHKGNLKKTEKFLEVAAKKEYLPILMKYGAVGVSALVDATPVDTGLTASSWDFKIKQTQDSVRIIWTNSHVVDGVPIAIILQYGHGTRNGGYVQGRDYINPALKPVFDRIAEDVWREVTK